MSAAAGWYNFLGNNAVQVDAAQAEQSVREKYPLLLHANERVELAFKDRGGLGRDKSYFTSHRILLKDGKGVGSKRKNYLSLPYPSIQAFSIETAGKFDGDVELKVWCTGKNFTKIDFAAGQVDIFGIQQYLNSKINWLGAQGSQDYVHGEPLSENKPSSFGKLMDWLGDNAQQLSPAAVEQQFKKDAPVLMENEKVHLAFRSGRDLTVFTDLRYLTIDKQGVFGKKVVFESFPWRSFVGFSVETAGAYFDRDTEIHLYTNIAAYGVLHQDFRNGAADVFAIQKHLANMILGEDVTHLPGLDLKQGHIDPKTSWWFRDNQRPLDATEMDKYYHETVPLLQGSEHVELAFKGRRDITFFTTKRIIYIDPKGFKGVKVEYTSIPWKSVVCFGVKTAGKHLDKDCEAMIYTDMMFDPPVKEDEPPQPGMSFWELDFNKDLVNALAIEKYLSARCLQQAPNIPVPPNVFMVSEDEGGLEKLLSRLGDDQRAIDPSELDTIFHTTLPILLDDEKIIMAFKAGRDMTLFTNLRIMELDTQDWSGQKTVYRSIPYASIRAFTAESAGGWDRDAELGIYTRNLWSLQKLKIDFRKGKADIVAIQKFIAAMVLQNHDEAGRYLESRESAVPKVESANFNSFLSFLTDNSKEEDASIIDVQLHSDPPILLDAEHVARAFRSGRDMFVYTNLRVLLVDVQGLRGKKVEYKSIPWTWCQDFEIETAGHLDRDAELYLHLDIPAIDVLKHSILVNSFDIHEMQAFICSTLLFPKAADA